MRVYYKHSGECNSMMDLCSCNIDDSQFAILTDDMNFSEARK